MTTALPADTIRDAVTTIHHGLVNRRRIQPDRWDQAVIALAAARTQLGGTPRRLIHRLFLGARSDQPLDLAAIVAALTDYLDTHMPTEEGDSHDAAAPDDIQRDDTNSSDQHPDEQPPDGQQQLFD